MTSTVNWYKKYVDTFAEKTLRRVLEGSTKGSQGLFEGFRDLREHFLDTCRKIRSITSSQDQQRNDCHGQRRVHLQCQICQ